MIFQDFKTVFLEMNSSYAHKGNCIFGKKVGFFVFFFFFFFFFLKGFLKKIIFSIFIY